MDEQIEIWKDIPGYEGLYAGSNFGRIKSYDRITMRKMNGGGIYPQKYKGRILKQYLNNCGYYFVRLCQDGVLIGFYVHILIADAFYINTNRSLVVNHKDGHKENNRADNLEWITRSDNQLHAYANGLQKAINGDAHHLTKLKHADIIKIKEWARKGMQQKLLADKYNVSKSLINIIVKGKHRKYA